MGKKKSKQQKTQPNNNNHIKNNNRNNRCKKKKRGRSGGSSCRDTVYLPEYEGYGWMDYDETLTGKKLGFYDDISDEEGEIVPIQSNVSTSLWKNIESTIGCINPPFRYFDFTDAPTIHFSFGCYFGRTCRLIFWWQMLDV